MPELILAAVVEEATNVPEAVAAELRARGPRWRAIQIVLFVKLHRLDEHGTIDSFPVAQLNAQPLELGEPENVRRQIRDLLAGAAETIAQALRAQGLGGSAVGVPDLPVEMDLQRQLATQLPGPQPRVADVTPAPVTLRGDDPRAVRGQAGAQLDRGRPRE